jgi:integrase
MHGRDAPKRGPAGAFRRRVPRDLPKQLDPLLIEQLIATARSWRDKAILTLLYRTGQRIGDWSSFAGRHGVLGMTLADIDERTRTITVRLKGARDEHVVPITDDFWPLFHHYLTHERPTDPALQAAWVGLRKSQGKPLSYAAFESSLRFIGRKLDLNVNAHMLRHTLAQALVDTGNLKVAQEILGHRHISTTADTYAHADEHAMLAAITTAQRHCDGVAQDNRAAIQAASNLAPAQPTAPAPPPTFVFPYDATTLAELDAAAAHQPHLSA